jgi:small conductance mechanosensitive channel
VDYTLKIMLIITVASILGVPMTSMLAVLGSAGLAIGLALQGSLSNIAGSFIIFIFKPFVVGDYIITGDHSGKVHDISLFYTTILTDDNKRILIPNSIVSNQTVTDVSSMPTRRVDFNFSTAYDTDIDKVKTVLLETAAAHTLVLKNPAPFAYLDKHTDVSLIFVLRVWCNNTDYWTVYVNLIENIKKAFEKNGISIPFPQFDIHLDRK